MQKVFKTGMRDSPLSLIQSSNAIRLMEDLFQDIKFEKMPMSSPGDKDRTTDLRIAAPDFFTRFLDDAVRSGEVDCAVHSAKDLPVPVPEDLDWFWLPWYEDQRDALILAPGKTRDDFPEKPVFGISSERRQEWAYEHFPNAIMKNIRGNIDMRIAQVDSGDYDAVIMAVAALNRLDITDRITEYIPLSELEVPEAQGYLAVTFLKGNEEMQKLRNFFMKTINFVGAGPGDPNLITNAGIKVLKNCDICLYDALANPALLKYLSPNAKAIFVGKRAGEDCLNVEDIKDIILDYSRRGFSVVRLKGGDAGIFGRLQEEIDALNELKLPYRIIPGISSFQLAASSGIQLTRNEVSRGFSVICPEMEGDPSVKSQDRADLPIVVFMGKKRLQDISTELQNDGLSPDTPVAVILDASLDSQRVISSDLGRITDHLEDCDSPALLIIGENTNPKYLYENFGCLKDQRILVTCSPDLQKLAAKEILDRGGQAIDFPLIKLSSNPGAIEDINQMIDYDWCVLTSPAAVRCFMQLISEAEADIRDIPKILISGPGIERTLNHFNLGADAQPDGEFSSNGMLAVANSVIKKGDKVLRFKSDKATSKVADHLRELDAEVKECILYHNTMVQHDECPDFDTVFFTSGSTVDSFMEQFGKEALEQKNILCIGQPSASALVKWQLEPTIVSRTSTIPHSIEALAVQVLLDQLNS